VVDGGLTRITQQPWYVYLTPNELAFGQPYGDPAVEVIGDRRIPVCNPTDDGPVALDLRCGSHTRSYGQPQVHQRGVPLLWHVPFLMAAVDPAAEAALVGLDDAVVSGSYLSNASPPPGAVVDDGNVGVPG
jgi:hypothetical protein